MDYVHMLNNLADQFTKGLSCNVIERASREISYVIRDPTK